MPHPYSPTHARRTMGFVVGIHSPVTTAATTESRGGAQVPFLFTYPHGRDWYGDATQLIWGAWPWSRTLARSALAHKQSDQQQCECERDRRCASGIQKPVWKHDSLGACIFVGLPPDKPYTWAALLEPPWGQSIQQSVQNGHSS